MLSESLNFRLLVLLAATAAECRAAQHDAVEARRLRDRAEADAAWQSAAVLGETASETFAARALAVRLARNIQAHRASTEEPRENDLRLWQALEAAWEGLDQAWGIQSAVLQGRMRLTGGTESK